MELKREVSTTEVIRFSIEEAGKEVARARLCMIPNDLHSVPYGYIEDVFVDQKYRGKSLVTKLMQAIDEEIQKRGSHKLTETSRFENTKVHDIYEHLGFVKWGYEFRKDFRKGE